MILSSILAIASAEAAAEDSDFFEKKIRPLFAEHCYECHSSTAKKLKGGLRLDTVEHLARGGTSGKTFFPGDPENSLIIKAVRRIDPDFQMPPNGPALSEAQITDLTEWIRRGATLPEVAMSAVAAMDPKSKWAFNKPSDPGVPTTRDIRWAKQPFDHFILAKLEEAGVKPAEPADKRTLIRRATYDLIGLPPTPQEIEVFLKDNSKDAFARVVDRLLSSPQYGERWGRHWLDVVRYADSADARVTGQDDDFSEAWRYRDWVVNGFNQDIPYDRFIIQQIAGDLLPPTEPDGLDTNAVIATGMYAIGNWGNGDADKEKILTDIADDAVDVTGRAFLGLTLACARCHDHKFDPISIEDYYGMAGIFFSSHIIPELTPKGAGEKMLRIPLVSKNEMENRQKREARLVELEKEVEQITDKEIAALAKEMLPRVGDYLLAVESSQNKKFSSEEKNLNPIVLNRWIDFLKHGHFGLLPNPIKGSGANEGLLIWRNATADDTPAAIYNSGDKELAKIPAGKFAIHPSPSQGIAVGWRAPSGGVYSVRGKITDVDAACGDGVNWTIAKRASAMATLAEGSISNGNAQDLSDEKFALALSKVALAAGEMLQVTILPNNGHSCDTTVLELEIRGSDGKEWNVSRDVGGEFLARNPLADHLGNPEVWFLMDLATQAPLQRLLLTSTNDSDRRQSAAQIQAGLNEAIASTNAPEAMRKLVDDLTSSRGPFWGPLRNSPSFHSSERSQKLKTELAALKRQPFRPIEFANGLQDGGVPESPHAGVHDAKVHIRGRYDRLGELVPRRFPRILAGTNQPAIANGSGRLQLAQWIASTNNPLTARVMVNRIWMHHFGEGIVRTPNNYGKLGAEPTHPELLDFLAHRFMESGWSIKTLHRKVMLSATYQQSSHSPSIELDPENKLFGRMNRRRLEAEPLRDSLLFVAGQLDRAMFGPSIRDLENKRRTLYLMTIRSDRSNYRMLFDAADPVNIAEQRNVSTVAPQALFLLNHPFIIEQASQLTDRLYRESSTSEVKKIQWLYETLYGRRPSSREIKIAREAIASGRKDPSAGAERQAWETYCQTLLCGNEFIYID